MDNRQQRTVTAFEQALIYLEQHPIPGAPPLLDRMRQSLSDTVEELQRLSARQNLAAKGIGGGAKDHHNRRNGMRREMMAIVRIAGPLLKFAPGAEDSLRVPHKRADTATVAAAVVKMALFLEGHAALLEEAGYGRSFLQQFRTDAELLAESAHASESRGGSSAC